jgi:hypothetical protein
MTYGWVTGNLHSNTISCHANPWRPYLRGVPFSVSSVSLW